METRRRLSHDFAHLLSGNVFYSACQWGIVLVLARLGSAEMVGEYALGMAVCGPAVLFGTFQLRGLVASDVSRRFAFGDYLAFRLISLAIVLAIVCALAFGLQTDVRIAGVIVLVGAAQTAEAVGDTYYGLMQRNDRTDRLSRSLLVKGPLSLGLLAVALYVTHSIMWALAGLMLGRMLVLLLWDSHVIAPEDRLEKVEARRLSTLLWLALPLGVISMLVSLNSNIPRYFIEGQGGRAQLGVFAAIASLMTLGSLVMSALGQSLYVPVARACAAGDVRKYRSLVGTAIGSGAALGMGALVISLLFGPQLLGLLFGAEFAHYGALLALLMVAGTVMFVSSGLGHIVTAARSLMPQVPLLILVAVACAGASAVLIPRFGLNGAAGAMILAALVQLGGTLLILLKIDRQIRPAEDAAVTWAKSAMGGLQ